MRERCLSHFSCLGARKLFGTGLWHFSGGEYPVWDSVFGGRESSSGEPLMEPLTIDLLLGSTSRIMGASLILID